MPLNFTLGIIVSIATIFVAALAVGQADVSCNPDNLRRQLEERVVADQSARSAFKVGVYDKAATERALRAARVRSQYCSFSNFYAMLLSFPPKEQTWREPRQHSEPVSD